VQRVAGRAHVEGRRTYITELLSHKWLRRVFTRSTNRYLISAWVRRVVATGDALRVGCWALTII